MGSEMCIRDSGDEGLAAECVVAVPGGKVPGVVRAVVGIERGRIVPGAANELPGGVVPGTTGEAQRVGNVLSLIHI